MSERKEVDDSEPKTLGTYHSSNAHYETVRREDLPPCPLRDQGVDWDTMVVDMNQPLGTYEDMLVPYLEHVVSKFPDE